MSDGEVIRIDFQDRRLQGEAPAGHDAFSRTVALIIETERSLLAQGFTRTDRGYYEGMISAQQGSSDYNNLTSEQQDEALEMAVKILAEEQQP